MKYNFHQSKGQCSVCKKINHTSIWSVFEEVSYFRGDDKYLGKFCKNCKKGRFREDSLASALDAAQGEKEKL